MSKLDVNHTKITPFNLNFSTVLASFLLNLYSSKMSVPILLQNSWTDWSNLFEAIPFFSANKEKFGFHGNTWHICLSDIFRKFFPWLKNMFSYKKNQNRGVQFWNHKYGPNIRVPSLGGAKPLPIPDTVKATSIKVKIYEERLF